MARKLERISAIPESECVKVIKIVVSSKLPHVLNSSLRWVEGKDGAAETGYQLEIGRDVPTAAGCVTDCS